MSEEGQNTGNIKSKVGKRPGPIRTGLVVPIIIFVILWISYFHFFFDGHLRRGIEFAATHMVGAEVNLKELESSFFNASLRLAGIQITDKEKPTHNSLEIGEVRFKILWDAILRAKVVIDEATVLNVFLDSPRKFAGRVLPKEPESEEKPSQLRQQAIEKLGQSLQGNALGDIATLLSGNDKVGELKNLEDQLKSSGKIKVLQDELRAKQAVWKKKLSELPADKDFKALQDRMKQIKVDGFHGPDEIQKSLKEIEALYKDIDSQVKMVKSTSDDLHSDVNKYRDELNELEKMAQDDLKDLEAKLKIPKLDAKSLALNLLGPGVVSKVRKAEFYISKAREYMPPKKTNEEKQTFKPKPHERGRGRVYQFGRPNSYPLFWLKLAKITSKASESGTSGNLSGSLTNVSSDAHLTGKPAVLELSGGFPAQKLEDLLLRLEIDHTGESPEERLKLKVGKLSSEDLSLSNSDDVKIRVVEPQYSVDLMGVFRGNELSIDSKSNVARPKFDVGAKNARVQEVLGDAFAKIGEFHIQTMVSGEWSAPKLEVHSNIGEAIETAFSAALAGQIAKAKEQVRSLYDSKVGAEKQKLMNEFKLSEGELSSLLTDREAGLKKLQELAPQLKDKISDSQKKKLEGEGKKVLDDLKKKFKF